MSSTPSARRVIASPRRAVEPSSAYRNLERLEQLGAIRHVHLGHGPSLYLLVGSGEKEFLLCERCGRVRSVDPSELVFSLRTFAFTDRYKLCVEAPVQKEPRECGYWFPRDRGNGVYGSNVGFRQSFFYKGPGTYRVSWWSGDGNRLGKALTFVGTRPLR